MKRLDLSEWAAISEILGTLGIIISLIFVAHSINQNSAVVQTNNENFLYQLTDASLELVASEPQVSELYVKLRRNEELSDAERYQYEAQLTRFLNRWELAFNRYQGGMFPPDQWHSWRKNYEMNVDSENVQKMWDEWKGAYGDRFVSYVDSILSTVQ